MRNIFLAIAAAAMFTGLSGPALAECKGLEAILANAYPAAIKTEAGLEIDGDYRRLIDPQTVACNVWPAKPDVTLLAVPQIELAPPDDDQRRGDIELIAVESRTGRLIARYIETSAAFSDAILFSGVRLDTARYNVGDGKRAFGLRILHRTTSGPNPYSDEVLSLYLLDDNKISPILTGFYARISRGENDGMCNGYFETTENTITMGNPRPDRFRDLRIHQTLTMENFKSGANDCDTVSKSVVAKQFVLHYGDPYYGGPANGDGFKDETYNELFSLAPGE